MEITFYIIVEWIRMTINQAINAQWALINFEIPTRNRHISCHIRIIRRIEISFELLHFDEIRIFPSHSPSAISFVR